MAERWHQQHPRKPRSSLKTQEVPLPREGWRGGASAGVMTALGRRRLRLLLPIQVSFAPVPTSATFLSAREGEKRELCSQFAATGLRGGSTSAQQREQRRCSFKSDI